MWTSVSAPTSSKLTSGMVAKPSRCDEGCTTDSAAVKSDAEMHSGASSDRLSGAGGGDHGCGGGFGRLGVLRHGTIRIRLRLPSLTTAVIRSRGVEQC